MALSTRRVLLLAVVMVDEANMVATLERVKVPDCPVSAITGEAMPPGVLMAELSLKTTGEAMPEAAGPCR